MFSTLLFGTAAISVTKNTNFELKSGVDGNQNVRILLSYSCRGVLKNTFNISLSVANGCHGSLFGIAAFRVGTYIPFAVKKGDGSPYSERHDLKIFFWCRKNLK